MIRIVGLKIREFRGIRDATFRLDQKSFAIYGPNGSGKSGVVDAIQFALTGEVGRLTGEGSGDLSLTDHGPHITHRKQPDQAVVELEVFIPSLGKAATVTRSVAHPRSPFISPDEPEIRAILAEMESHPEVTLARREIIKLILTPGADRSRAVQALLHQEEIEQARKTLRTTTTRARDQLAEARRVVSRKTEALRAHLGVPLLRPGLVLEAVNARRRVLGLDDLGEWSRETSFTAGIGKPANTNARRKATDLADIRSLADATQPDERTRQALGALVHAVGTLKGSPGLRAALRTSDLSELGLELLAGPSCPLCDLPWDEGALRRHLDQKLRLAKDARNVRGRLVASAGPLRARVRTVREAWGQVRRIPEAEKAGNGFGAWDLALQQVAEDLGSPDTILVSDRLTADCLELPPDAAATIAALTALVEARPDVDAAADARDFLVVAQERFADLQSAKRSEQEASGLSGRVSLVYGAYREASERLLLELYHSIEADFVAYYRALNPDDEGGFQAQLQPDEASLDLSVDFYGKGMFPPGALHSEGHQDGMGLCLYLALLKRLLGPGFLLAVLDDVVMSVDAEHRRRVGELLVREFAETQFVITTHDRVWATQMQKQGLLQPRNVVSLSGWSVDTGPIVDADGDVWALINEALKRNDVPAAASRLRRYAEFTCRELAERFVAQVPFRFDGSYELGELLQAVVSRYGGLLEKAERAARKWKQADELEALGRRRGSFDLRKKGIAYEQWMVNPSVHYNEWANLTAAEFGSVVGAFHELFDEFCCPDCRGWLGVTARWDPKDLRCPCGRARWNLSVE